MIDFYKKDEKGIGFWIDSYIIEDFYFTIKYLAEKNNPNRFKRWTTKITLLFWILRISIPLKRVGWIYYGKDKNPALKVKK